MKNAMLFMFFVLLLVLSACSMTADPEDQSSEQTEGKKIHYKIKVEERNNAVILKISEDNGFHWRQVKVYDLQGKAVFHLSAKIKNGDQARIRLITDDNLSEVIMFSVDLKTEAIL